MANPEPAGEPSMEDILASIRRIISDDEDTGEETKEADVPKAKAEPETAEEVDFDAIDVDEEPAAADETNDQSSIDDIFDLTEVVEDEPDADEPVSQADVDAMDFDAVGDDAEDAADLDFVDAETTATDNDAEVDFAVASDDPAEDKAEPEKPNLLSPDAQATASAAFGALASTMLSHSGGARTLEEIVEDLLRPLLRAWLDQNLPPLVEKLVREEIERVARRGQ